MPPKIISISGHIGFDITASFVRNELSTAKGKPVEAQINSPGGFVSEGLEIINLFKEYSGQITIKIMGQAASMAASIASIPGIKTIAHKNTVLMIHNAMTISIGNHNDMRKTADRLEGLSSLIAEDIAQKTGKTLAEIREMMDDETFLFGKEILEHGFVDEIIETNIEDEKDRDSAVLRTQLAVENCFNKMRESAEAKADLEKAAAYIGKMNISKKEDENSEEFNPEAPFPNEHACRIRKPGDFQKDSFRRIKSSGEGKKFDIIIGRLKGKTTTTTQAFRYPKSTWSASEARKHCKDHDGILFEPASAMSGCSECNKDKSKNHKKEVITMTLTELLAANPSAKAEYDQAISNARTEGSDANQKEVQANLDKIAPIIASDKYPAAIRNLASEVMQGKEEYAALKGAVTMFDATQETKASEDAAGETGEAGETPPKKGDESVAAEDGSINNETDHAAAVSRIKEAM